MRCPITITFLSLLLLVAACSHGGRLKTESGLVVTPPNQAEQPTQVTESKASQALSIPAGSTIRVVHTPATPSAPESTQTTYTLAKDSVQSLDTSSQTVSLSPTRKPDTSVVMHELDLKERRILLYAAIAALALGIAAKSLYPAWPGASTSLFIAAGILGAAWKFIEVPWWAALAVVGLYVAIAGGYKRGEVDEKAPK